MLPPAPVIPLIPRTALFGIPAIRTPKISPDGTRLAYLSRADGALNMRIGDRDELGRSK